MSSKGDLLRTQSVIRGALDTRESKRTRFTALMGDGAGTIKVSGEQNFVYVRTQGRGRVDKALNVRLAPRNDLPIIVGYTAENPNTLEVLEVDWAAITEPGDYAYVPHHHQAHELRNADGGDDVVWVQKQQVLPLLCRPTDPVSMFVVVLDDWYPWDTGWNYFEGATSANLTGYIPVLPGEARFVLISIDGATNTLQYTSGTEFVIGLPLADIDVRVPAPPLGSVPVCAVYIAGTTTTLGWENLYDLRLFNSPVGGSVSPGPHELLDSAVHSDTETHTPPVQGDIIVGNATPAWDDLPIGIAHQLLKVNAGATDPAWSSFDWDDLASAVAADMVHDHLTVAEGGQLPATQIGQVFFSVDGAVLTAEVPLTGEAGWLVEEVNGVLLVV